MGSVDSIAEDYVERAAALDPVLATFSLKDFHSKALSQGAMGLDPLREALSRC